MGADVGKTGEYQSSFQMSLLGIPVVVAQYRAKNIDEMQYASEQVKAYENAVKNYKKYCQELDQAKVDGNEKAENQLKSKSIFIKRKVSQPAYCGSVYRAEGITEDESTKPYLDFINNLRDQWAITYNEMSGDTDAGAVSNRCFNRLQTVLTFLI